MCLRPRSIARYTPDGVYLYTDVVPCGECLECVKAKQTAYAIRSYLESLKTHNVDFLTLTYRPSALPLWLTECCMDADGSAMPLGPGRPLTLDEDRLYRDDYNHTGKIQGKYEPQFVGKSFDRDGFLMCNQVCASLNRRDVQLSLKRVRRRFERKYCKTCEMKYLCVGEHGTRGSRPHYHILLFGCDPNFVAEFKHDWETRFGQVHGKHVNTANDDYIKVSKYVGKYLTKGCFDKQHIFTGVCERPRIMLSVGLGSLDQFQISRLRCDDLLNEIAPDGTVLRADQLLGIDDHCNFSHGMFSRFVPNDNFFLEMKRVLRNNEGHFPDYETFCAFKDTFDSFGLNIVCDIMSRRRRIHFGDWTVKRPDGSRETTPTMVRYPQYYNKYFCTTVVYYTREKLYNEEFECYELVPKKHVKILRHPTEEVFSCYVRLRSEQLRFDELQELQRQYPTKDFVELCRIQRDHVEADIRSRSDFAYRSLKKKYQSDRY